VVRHVPNGSDSHSQSCIRTSIRSLDTVHRILRIDRGKYSVAVAEGFMQILDKLRFGFGRRRTAPLALEGRSLTLNLVKERDVGTSNMFYLLSEDARL
jgi:hypothetical protein